MKAVGSPSSSGPEGPPPPPHASPLCHPCFLPPSRVACDCPEDVRSSWKVIQHPLITFVPSISQCLNLASGAWALGTQLLPPPTPHPQQKQEYESQDGTSPLAPVPYRPGGGSGTSPGGPGTGGTLDSGRDPSFCSCQLELQVMMQKNDTCPPSALSNDGAACRGRGRESDQNVRDTGSEVRQAWVLSFHSTTCQHWASQPASLGVFSSGTCGQS